MAGGVAKRVSSGSVKRGPSFRQPTRRPSFVVIVSPPVRLASPGAFTTQEDMSPKATCEGRRPRGPSVALTTSAVARVAEQRPKDRARLGSDLGGAPSSGDFFVQARPHPAMLQTRDHT